MFTTLPVPALVPTVNPALPLFQTVLVRMVSTLLEEPLPMMLPPVLLKISLLIVKLSLPKPNEPSVSEPPTI